MAIRDASATTATTIAGTVMADEDTRTVSVPTPPGPPVSRRAPWWAVLSIVLAAVTPVGVLVLSVLGPPSEVRASRGDPGTTEEVVYGYAIVPGDAAGTEGRVRVTGRQAFDDAGDVLFVTVSIPSLSWLDRLVLRDADPRVVDLLTARELLGDRTPEQERKENLRLMGDSKRLATYVAMRTLGIEVPVRDGGVQIDRIACEEVGPDGSTCAREAPAGRVLQKNDLIVAVDGRPVHLVPDLPAAIAGRAPGDVVEVTVLRGSTTGTDGQRMTMPVTLVRSGDRTILGIRPKPLPPGSIRFDFPFEVDIATGSVGGPSAGLPFTLAVLDRLTEGELTGGRIVAATGEIDPTGAIGEIGGLAQKTQAVLRAGASVFLVPQSQVDEARAIAAGTTLEVVPVRTIADALDALAARGGIRLPAA
jgi:PDZ domain-containing protein